jgi:hypothetical protein
MEIPLVNAQEMREKFPGSFEVPTVEQVGHLRIGDFVKVCCHSERFWAIVTGVRAPELQDLTPYPTVQGYVLNTVFVATVDNHIVGTAPCKYRDSILVRGYEIYAITHPEPVNDQRS